jgi:hypothetical protein
MRSLRLKISDLLKLDGAPLTDRVPDLTELTPLVLQRFGFLPQPLTITVEGDEVLAGLVPGTIHHHPSRSREPEQKSDNAEHL